MTPIVNSLSKTKRNPDGSRKQFHLVIREGKSTAQHANLASVLVEAVIGTAMTYPAYANIQRISIERKRMTIDVEIPEDVLDEDEVAYLECIRADLELVAGHAAARWYGPPASAVA